MGIAYRPSGTEREHENLVGLFASQRDQRLPDSVSHGGLPGVRVRDHHVNPRRDPKIQQPSPVEPVAGVTQGEHATGVADTQMA
jgi:hypothetical protein